MKRSRYIQSVIATANTSETVLPWTRGARRRAFILKRRALATRLKSA